MSLTGSEALRRAHTTFADYMPEMQRWAQFGHITDEATWDLIRSHAPVQADGITPFDTTQRFEGISYLAVTVGLKYHF